MRHRLKNCCGETPQPTRATRALPDPLPGLGEILFVDLEADEVLYIAALGSDGRISNA